MAKLEKDEQMLEDQIWSYARIWRSEADAARKNKKANLIRISEWAIKSFLLPGFKDKAKRLARKFPSLKNELEEFEKSLSNDPQQGTPLGREAYKDRLAVRSKGRGKSGGIRIITYIISKKLEILSSFNLR